MAVHRRRGNAVSFSVARSCHPVRVLRPRSFLGSRLISAPWHVRDRAGIMVSVGIKGAVPRRSGRDAWGPVSRAGPASRLISSMAVISGGNGGKLATEVGGGKEVGGDKVSSGLRW